MKPTLTLVTPQCTCCAQPTTLLPREDLGQGLAVCSQSGQLYRPEGNNYIPTQMPMIRPTTARTNRVQIDLSRTGYS